MERDIQTVLLSEEQIQAKVKELGAILAEEYRDKNPIFVGVLKGVVVFYADMIRAINIPCEMDLQGPVLRCSGPPCGDSGGHFRYRQFPGIHHQPPDE